MKTRLLPCLGLWIAPLAAAQVPAPPPPVEISAKAEAPVEARPEIYGHNMPCKDWQGTATIPPALWDPATDAPDPAWGPLTHLYPLHLVRFHMENNYPWRDEVGPRAQRKPMQGQYGFYGTGAGLDEFLRWAESLPDQPAVSLIASPIRPVQELADLVAYCNATTGPMAELRAENGHPAPYQVKIWELGNEMDWSKRKNLDPTRADTAEEADSKMRVSEYVSLCLPVIAAMRAVDPSIRIYAQARTAPWAKADPDWASWHREVLLRMGGEIDGIAIHPYYDGLPVPYVLASVDAVAADIHKLEPPGRHLTVWVSEHARWVPVDRDHLAERPQSWSLQGAISTADFLLRCMGRPDVSMADYWSYIHRGPWRVLNADWAHGGSPKFGTAINELYRMLDQAYGDQFQALDINQGTFTANPPGYPYTVTAGRFNSREGRLKSVVVANRSAAQGFTLTIPQAEIPASAGCRLLLLTAPELRSTNVPETPDAVALQISSVEVSAENGVLRLNVPPRCVAAWVWE